MTHRGPEQPLCSPLCSALCCALTELPALGANSTCRGCPMSEQERGRSAGLESDRPEVESAFSTHWLYDSVQVS